MSYLVTYFVLYFYLTFAKKIFAFQLGFVQLPMTQLADTEMKYHQSAKNQQ